MTWVQSPPHLNYADGAKWAEALGATEWEHHSDGFTYARLPPGTPHMTHTTHEIMAIVDRASEPGTMTKREALEFLEELAAELESRIDALKDELRHEEKED